MDSVQTILMELLGQLGSSREAREYMQRFSSGRPEQFAVIKVGGGVIAKELPQLVNALAFLRQVGLMPIVLHGAGPQMDAALSAAGVESDVVDGMRVTTPKVMQVVRPAVYAANLELSAGLQSAGVSVRSITHGIFEADFLDQPKYGLVGDVCSVDADIVRRTIAAGSVPVIACLGETKSGQVLNINADVAVRALAKSINPGKIVFLTPTGGLLDEQGQIISAINLATDYEFLLSQDWVHSGMRLKLVQIRYLLDQLGGDASVSITSAKHLSKELFTHAGAGTLIRSGEQIDHLVDPTSEQFAATGALLERCFGKQLDASYLDQLVGSQLLLARSGRAAAVIASGVEGAHYLDKFAVTPEARGVGLGAALWKKLGEQSPVMYWRSRRGNDINDWYFRQCDTAIKQGEWIVFGKGVPSSLLQDCVEDATKRPVAWKQEAVA